MQTTVDIRVPPSLISDERALRNAAAEAAGWAPSEVRSIRVIRRSIDARGSTPVFQLRVVLHTEDLPVAEDMLPAEYPDVHDREPVIVVGAGPAGYFAALELISLGWRPLVFDRGKDVRARRRDLRAIQQFGVVNEDSNYCFGEGGAGTYSDGKLYTRSHKRGDISKALRILVAHGAQPDILVDAHPHIGSNKLPGVVTNLRETILRHGGEVHFQSRVTDFLFRDKKMEGVVINGQQEVRARAVILATGHSARDIYRLLADRGIGIAAKPFALGVRIEHPQGLIDGIQYGQPERDPALPASSYRLACQVSGRGIFSFCMCPGGLVVPAATAPGELVVNGMSMSRRDSPYANSGTVVQVELEDLPAYRRHGPFQVMAFQQEVEQRMFQAGDGSQRAPAQRLTDFIQRKVSRSLSPTSYIPGLWAAPLHTLLPDFIYARLQQAVRIFGKQMRGYHTEEANVIGTESRSSAPVRIPRNKETYMHDDAAGLFPAGEGAGYAGGIISAALDGQNVAQAVARFLEA